jgi:hypothetical protein
MSEFEQDPSASTGRFRAFVERGDDDTPRARRSPVSPPTMIAGAVVVIAVIVAIVIAVA